MQNLDSDEKRIRNAFSRINVDTKQLERNLEYMNKPKRIKRRITLAIATALIFVALSATVYASVGRLDGFLARFNPEFGEFALPPLELAYAEDQGIKLEVVGARIFENTVLIYYTMHDLTGEDRLTRYIRPDFEVFANGELLSNGGSSGRFLHFNEVNNRAYLEVGLQIDANTVWTDNTLELRATNLHCFERSGQLMSAFSGDWRIDISIDDTEEKAIIWTDIATENFHIDYMALSVMGLRIIGTHEGYFLYNRHCLSSVDIEIENRLSNVRFLGSSGGVGPDCFDFFFSVKSPIDMEAVTGVVVKGVHIPTP